MTVVRRALLLSTGERYFALVSSFATLAIISRILTPDEIGVSVIGMAVVGIAMAVREFASASYIIQHRDLSEEAIRGAFSTMLVLTLLIAGALVLLAPLLAWTYDEKRLAPYLYVVSGSFVLDLISMLIITLMRREMRFGVVALISIAGAATALVTSTVLALLGFSYMSLAWGWLSGTVITAAVALCLRPDLRIFVPSLSHWREVVTFGGYNGATVFLHKAYEALPYLLLGRVISPHASALFNRTVMICQLPDKIFLSGAMSVVLPAFSADAREGRSLKAPYLHALGLVTAFQWPALVVLALLAHPVVQVVLGEQWTEVAPLVRIAALAYLFAFSFELNYPIFVSLGAVRDMFYRALIVCPVSAIIMTAAAFLGGLHAIVYSLMLIIPFQAFVSFHFIRRRISLELSEIFASIWRSAVVAAFSAAGPLVVLAFHGFRFDLSIGQAFVAGALAGAGWLGGLQTTGHPLRSEIVNAVPARWRALPVPF